MPALRTCPLEGFGSCFGATARQVKLSSMFQLGFGWGIWSSATLRVSLSGRRRGQFNSRRFPASSSEQNCHDQDSISPQISVIVGQTSGHPRLRPAIHSGYKDFHIRRFAFLFVVSVLSYVSWMSPIEHQYEFVKTKVWPVGILYRTVVIFEVLDFSVI